MGSRHIYRPILIGGIVLTGLFAGHLFRGYFEPPQLTDAKQQKHFLKDTSAPDPAQKIIVGALGHIPGPAVPVIGPIPEFQLTNSRDQEFNSRDMIGKIWLTDFIFTTCSGICPVMTRNMHRIYREFGDTPHVEFVSISVNPENDTPEVLAQYAKRFSINTHRWHFLTGQRDDIQRIAVEYFKVGSTEEPVFHSSYFVLVDDKGQVRGYYDGVDEKSIPRIKKDVLSLLSEARNELR